LAVTCRGYHGAGSKHDAKEHDMSARRIVLAAGAILVIAGVIALLVPVSVPNGNGSSIGCGNAVAEDLSGARSANDSTVANVPILNQIVPHSDFVAQCQSAVSSRRAWSIPVTVLGALVAAGALVVRPRGAAGTR
jgi:hypothetical protein